MTRQEEIRQASIKYTCRNSPMYIGGSAFSEMIEIVVLDVIFIMK